MKKIKYILRVTDVVFIIILCGKCVYTNTKFETQYDQEFTSPNKVNAILVCNDYKRVSKKYQKNLKSVK
ncbi:hypothetical protein M2475_002138 [Breznakia sp. PF5-3]|uniref:hypothetical protein n=1 Tax=unclassified Breznakia TaxID=2623764 RepID=UPI0024066252|nr:MULTISPECIES: hypothetical protein [unclassified Breznakia]MDF9825752.1 hypothetical protein [Breznakia sp. PM6-1]MDF9836557.1 hypothetical protein [Breznakia sp. PF5-3]MDF9838775.1 hypothetical protein [Breznakia sp. PFB2-8]MDF9860811.1 hypothetical protein [Breznakia sp. PH5-24]